MSGTDGLSKDAFPIGWFVRSLTLVRTLGLGFGITSISVCRSDPQNPYGDLCSSGNSYLVNIVLLARCVVANVYVCKSNIICAVSDRLT